MTKPVNGLLILRLIFICSIVIGLFGKPFQYRDSQPFETIILYILCNFTISMKIQYEDLSLHVKKCHILSR